MPEQRETQQPEGSSRETREEQSDRNRAHVKKRPEDERREQFAPGDGVWLKLPGSDARHPMVVKDTEMVPGTGDMRYKLENTDQQPYAYPNSTDGWVPERLVTERSKKT